MKVSILTSLLMTALALGGCAVSSGSGVDTGLAGEKLASDNQSQGNQVFPSIPVDMSQLPPLDEMAAKTVNQGKKNTEVSGAASVATSEKFSSEDSQILAIASADEAFEAKSSEIQQAYANAVGEHGQITTQKSGLKPFVGRWTLVPKGHAAKAKMQKIGAFLGLTEQCELVLEEQGTRSGYKAYGNSSCPTSLFMLDSWVPLGDVLVLRDHMGDEIVKLRSRGDDMWVGVDQRGETLVLNKS